MPTVFTLHKFTLHIFVGYFEHEGWLYKDIISIDQVYQRYIFQVRVNAHAASRILRWSGVIWIRIEQILLSLYLFIQ